MTDYADLVSRLKLRAKHISPDYVLDVEAADAIEALVKQFPEGMEGRKIIFSECAKGHGQLRGENWVENPCQICRAEAAEAQAAKLKEALTKIADSAPIEFVEIAERALEGK